jgi:hypothetical protein
MSRGGPARKSAWDLSLVQPGQVGAVLLQQPPAAAHPALGQHRDARRAERLHIAMDRALGHLQPLRQIAGGDAAVDLEQQQNRKQSIGAHCFALPL